MGEVEGMLKRYSFFFYYALRLVVILSGLVT